MNSLVVLATLPFIYGPHAWKHLHAWQAAPAPAVSFPATHDAVAVASGGNPSGPKWRASGYATAPARAAGPQTIHYVVIPIDCRYLTKAARARMCGRPLMRAAGAQVAKAKAPD